MTTTTTTMNAIGIVSKDIKRSLEFFKIIGVNVPEFDPNEDHVSAELGNGVTLMWDKVELMAQFMPEYQYRPGTTMGLCFECASPAEVDETFTRLEAAGFEVEKEPFDAFWGQRYAIVKDPDGHSTSLYAAL